MVESLQSPRRLNAAERQRQALELRKAGATYEVIAQKLGYRGPSSAYGAIKSALHKTLQPPADEVRALEIERLDALLLALWPQARQGNHGAIDRVLKVMERRARLLGLDAPTRTDITTGGQRLVIEYVNDWRGTSTLPSPWPDSGPATLPPDDGVERGPALAQDDARDGDYG